MGDKTGIEWTDATWNPLVGCSIHSLGCANCYAMKAAYRLGRMAEEAEERGEPSGTAHYKGVAYKSKAGQHLWTGEVHVAPESILLRPLKWTRPRRIFVNSMSDLFHESVPFETIDRVFAVMAAAPQHTFQLLTKRADRQREYLTRFSDRPEEFGEALATVLKAAGLKREVGIDLIDRMVWPLPNVWVGVTVEDQAAADWRIPELLNTPAAVRWLSVEPLIGPTTLWAPWIGEAAGPAANQAGIDWVVAGGESGPGARPMDPDWVRSVRDECARAGVPFLFKQWGDWLPVDSGHPDLGGPGFGKFDHAPVNDPGDATHVRVGKHKAGRLLDGVQHDGYPEARS